MATLITIPKNPKTVHAFGGRAKRFAEGLPAATSAVVSDGSDLVQAVTQATILEDVNTSFYNAVLLPDSRAEIAREAGAQILAYTQDEDQRRIAFDSIASGQLILQGTALANFTLLDATTLAGLHALAQKGDALLVRSQTERIRFEAITGEAKWTSLAPLRHAHVPQLHRRAGTRGVVVWAPFEPARALSIYAFAYWQLNEPVTFVCRGELRGTPHTYLSLEHAEHAMKNAFVIIDADLYDPGSALAFADRGYGIATARTSGAHEYLLGSITYDPADFLSIHNALSRARVETTVTIGDDALPDAYLQQLFAFPYPSALKEA